jgi:uncharacterized protein (DUF58 family)
VTTHGKTLALCALLAAIAGAVLGSRPTLAGAFAAAFALAADGAAWLLMARAARALRITRAIGQGRDHAVVFAGRVVPMRVRVANASRLPLAFTLRDLVPHGAACEGATSFAGELGPGGAAELAYRVRASGLARHTFPGVALTIGSPGGLWRATRIVELPGTLRVVPDIFAKHFLQPWRKGLNALLRHGRHMQRKAGFGAELLALRAYRDGDPLKSVAWRASARRDHLLVKEFENEVPVRARIVLAPSMRFYAGAAPALSAAAVFCARLARVLVEQRDLVEVIVPRAHGVARTGLGLTRRHLGTILNALGDAAASPPPCPLPLAPAELETIFEAALCRTPTLAHAAQIVRSRRTRAGFSAGDRRGARFALSLFLSAEFELGLGAVPLLARDDALLGFFGRAYMPEHPAVPAGDAATAWALEEAPAWARRLTRTLTRLIARAKDEELFIVMADLALLPRDARRPLLDALALARAHGHRVVVYWPAFAPEEGARKELLAERAAELAAERARLRGQGIPALAFDAEGGFLPVVRQLSLLKRAQGALRTW